MSKDEETSSNQEDSPKDSAGALRRERLEESSEDEEQKKAGMRGYQSEHNPGEKVRVARMTEDVSEPTTSQEESREDEEDSDQKRGKSFEVTVRGKGPSETKPKEQADDEESEQETAESSAEAAASSMREPAEKADDAPAAAEKETTSDRDVDMSAFEGDTESATTDDFAALFEGEGGVPQKQSYSSGDRVEGAVLEIGDQHIFVELDPQTEGIAKRREFEDDEGELELDVGDRHEFYVTHVTEDEVHLGEQLSGDQGSLDAIKEAYESGIPVEGKVTGTNKGGFEVKIHGIDAFCPISEIELGYTEEKDVHVGAKYRFRVTEVRDGGRTVVVSRAQILREERAEQAEKTLESLEEGAVVEGVVTRTTGFGAFVDLGGVEGLVHISELGHSHFDHPDEVVSEGETLEVEVLDIQAGGDGDSDKETRISLSKKATEKDPWEIVNEEFAVGENVEGTVVRNAPFGSFVEIAPGVEGLVHVSEMSWTEHVRTPDDIVEPGDKILVQVQDIDIPRKRVSLSIKAAEGDPWDDVDERYSPGMEVQGTVENIEDFGTFVKLPSGITALIPRSEMSLPNGVTPHRKFNQGEEVTAIVLNIDPAERKMALTMGGEESEGAEGEEQDEREASPAPATTGGDEGGGFGTLGDMIGDQLGGGDEDDS